MAERAHPDLKGFKNRFWGMKKNIYRENLYKRYEFCNAYIKDKRALDIPCGMGWGTSLLSGAGELFGVDKSREAIDEARRKYPRINFNVGDMTAMSFQDNFFDVLICLEGFEHLTYMDGQKFLKETKRVLTEGGLFIVTTPLLRDDKYHSGNIYHLCEYRRDELYQIIKDFRFKVIHEDFLSSPEKNEIIRLVLENN